MRSESCYVGIEAEGPYKNKNLLFVPGGVSPEEFNIAWTKMKKEVAGVYYGAGSNAPLRKDTIKRIEETDRGKVFVVEFVDRENQERYVFDCYKEKLYKKSETDLFVIWIEQPKVYFTWTNDIRFTTDKEV